MKIFFSLFINLFFGVFLCGQALAATAAQSLDKSFKAAEQLMLNSEREKAIQLLGQSWQKSSGKTRQRIEKKMDELARLFLTEAGQISYELGQAMNLENSSVAESHFRKALTTEDKNVSILFSLAALKIREKKWSQAEEFLETILSVLPSSSQAWLWKIRIEIEKGDLEQAETYLDQKKEKTSAEWEFLRALILLQNKKIEAASANIEKISTSNKSSVRVELLKFRLHQLKNSDVEPSGQAYLSLCKSKSPITLREISQDPFHCIEQDEVAKFIDEIESQTR